MNNAGVATHEGKKGTSWENRDVWTKVFNTNVVGCVSLHPRTVQLIEWLALGSRVLNVQHTFVQVRRRNDPVR